MFTRVLVVLFLSFFAITQASAKLSPLEVLEVLRQDYEAHTDTSTVTRSWIAQEAVELIITASFRVPHCRVNSPRPSHTKNTSEFPNILDHFNHKAPVITQDDLHGTTRTDHKYFRLAAKVATRSQKTSYVKWFIRASIEKVNVGSMLSEASLLRAREPSTRWKKHLDACSKLWRLINPF
ncbi:MAG: hypothetical protein WCG04_00705 [Alphaproteobacteria bacterium]